MPDGSGPALIKALPPELRRVPGYLSLSDDAWREAWFGWRDRLAPHRDETHDLCERDFDFRMDERLLCAADPKYWMAMWGWVYEPRARKAQGKHVPFTPFAFQCHVMDWLVALADNPEQQDGLIDKARGIGLSWTIVAFAVWGWAFHDITSLLLSKKQADVDRPNNMNTLFGKAIYMIDNMPEWMLPPGFNEERDRTQMNIANPDSHAQIFGDSTTGDAGRSARATIAFVDEAPFIRDLADVWSTLGGTTDHRVGLGSMTTKHGFTWLDNIEKRRQDDPETVYTLDWWLNPHQDEAWRQREYARREKDNDLPGYYCEIERNPWMGRTNIIYPEARSVTFDGPPYDPALPVIVGIDPGIVDDTAIIFGQPLDGDHRGGQVNWLDSYERSGMAAEYYAIILTGLHAYLEPGDLYHGHAFSRSEYQLMDWTRSLPWQRTRVVMDPAGKATDAGLNSFQLRIITFSRTLRKRWLDAEAKKLGAAADNLPRLRAIEPYCEKIIALQAHQARHNAARELLARSTFHDSPGTRRLVRALRNYRLGELTAKATREPVPIHDDDASHLATAFEWVAVYRGGGYLRIAAPMTPEPNQIAAWQRIGAVA